MQQRIEATTAALLAAIEQQGIPMTADGRVGEDAAASLIGYSPGSLKNMRTLGSGPAYYRRAIAGAKVSYKIEDLAEWLESARVECIFHRTA